MQRVVTVHFVLGAFLLVQGGVARLIGGERYATYGEVRQVLAALSDVLPADLRADGPVRAAAAWNRWVVEHDREIRNRLARGDEDTIVNWLLFGTSFTDRPRALLDRPSNAAGTSDAGAEAARLAQLVAGRTRDLAAALCMTGADERRRFAKRLLEQKGYRCSAAEDRKRLEEYLLAEVARIAREEAVYARNLADIRKLSDATAEFAARSRLFSTRGLSLDTSMLPSFAVERALEVMRKGELISPTSIRRVAIVGPGLDFSDKGSGYDFYPQQTVQPLTLIDSLVRLNLAPGPEAVEVTTLDISERVNEHLRSVTGRARSGSPSMLRFPLDLGLPWTPEVIDYWRRVGNQIGAEAQAPKAPAIGRQLAVRAVRIRPDVLMRIVPRDFNVVTERWNGAPFDLIIATNVLVYYDTLDQSLALANIEAMLRPGGILLSNDALLELPVSGMRSLGYLTVSYSTPGDNGDHIVWYRRG